MKFIKLTLSLLIFSAVFTSCDTTETIEMDRNTKPVAKVVTDNITINEGDTATIEISIDKPVTKPLIFKLLQVDGNAEKDTNFSFTSESAPDFGPIGGRIVIPAYETTGTLEVSSLADYFSSDNKNASFVLEPMESMNGLASGTVNLSITNMGPTEIISKLTWDITKSGDIDFYIINPAFDSIIAAGESVDMPEITAAISADDPDGTYTVWMHAYDVPSGVDSFDLNWAFSKPDGVIDTLDMIYDYANQDSVYTSIDIGVLVYHTVNIEKTGTDFVITLAN